MKWIKRLTIMNIWGTYNPMLPPTSSTRLVSNFLTWISSSCSRRMSISRRTGSATAFFCFFSSFKSFTTVMNKARTVITEKMKPNIAGNKIIYINMVFSIYMPLILYLHWVHFPPPHEHWRGHSKESTSRPQRFRCWQEGLWSARSAAMWICVN